MIYDVKYICDKISFGVQLASFCRGSDPSYALDNLSLISVAGTRRAGWEKKNVSI